MIVNKAAYFMDHNQQETYLKELSNLLKPLSPDLGMLLKNTMKNIKMKIVNL